MSDTVIPMPRVGCGKFISFANSALNHGNSVMPIPIFIVLIKNSHSCICATYRMFKLFTSNDSELDYIKYFFRFGIVRF